MKNFNQNNPSFFGGISQLEQDVFTESQVKALLEINTVTKDDLSKFQKEMQDDLDDKFREAKNELVKSQRGVRDGLYGMINALERRLDDLRFTVMLFLMPAAITILVIGVASALMLLIKVSP